MSGPDEVTESQQEERGAEDLAALITELCADALTGLSPNKIEETARPWLAKADLHDPDDPDQMERMMEALTFAAGLVLFTPTLNGAAAIERFIRDRRSDADADTNLALDILARAEFRLLHIDSVSEPDLFLVTDLATGEKLTLFEEITESAVGCDIALWLTRLPEGEIIALGPITPLDDAALDEAMKFIRPGKGMRNPHRCAAAIYRHVVRHDTLRIEGLNVFPEDDFADESSDILDEDEEEWDELQKLAVAFMALEIAEQCGESITEQSFKTARSLADAETLAVTLSRSIIFRDAEYANFADAYSSISYVMLETLDQRAEQSLDDLAKEIESAVPAAVAPEDVMSLFEELRAKLKGATRTA